MTRRSRRADAPLLVWRDGEMWRWSVRLPEGDVGPWALQGSVAHPTWQEAAHAATTAYPGLGLHVDRGSTLARLVRWSRGQVLALALVVAVTVAVAARLRARSER